MKIKHNNIFKKVLVQDRAYIGTFPYECDPDVPRVIVSEKPVIKIQEFSNRVSIIPFEMKTEEQFNRLVVASIVCAHKNGSNHNTKTLQEIRYIYADYNIGSINACLISENDTPRNKCMAFRKCYKEGILLIKSREVNPGYMYVLPEPEFLGIIAIRPIDTDTEWYGIGILNPLNIIKSTLQYSWAK